MVSVTAVEKCMDDWLQLYNHFVIGLNIRGLKAGLRKTSNIHLYSVTHKTVQ